MKKTPRATPGTRRAKSDTARIAEDGVSAATIGSRASADKAELRAFLRNKRRLRSQEQMLGVAGALGRMWPSLRSMADDPDLVLGYQPTRFEPDLRNLLSQVMSEETEVLLPRPHGLERLEWVSATPDHLESRLVKMPTPNGPAAGVGTEPFANKSTVVLIPALAADPTTGLRLGQGGGYYDRLIAGLRKSDCRVLLVAVVHESELLEVPALPHDQAVDVVLTETGPRVVGKS